MRRRTFMQNMVRMKLSIKLRHWSFCVASCRGERMALSWNGLRSVAKNCEPIGYLLDLGRD